MRGVIRYRGDDVVAILDSERAGESHDGVPIVATVADALGFEPQVALVGVATQVGRFPPAWRALLTECIRNGLSIENGLHQMLHDDLSRAAGPPARVELRDLSPPEDLDCPTAQTSRWMRRSSSRSARTARSGR